MDVVGIGKGFALATASTATISLPMGYGSSIEFPAYERAALSMRAIDQVLDVGDMPPTAPCGSYAASIQRLSETA
jgi:hypothetical protein